MPSGASLGFRRIAEATIVDIVRVTRRDPARETRRQTSSLRVSLRGETAWPRLEAGSE